MESEDENVGLLFGEGCADEVVLWRGVGAISTALEVGSRRRWHMAALRHVRGEMNIVTQTSLFLQHRAQRCVRSIGKTC
jgi:hypothetical protein